MTPPPLETLLAFGFQGWEWLIILIVALLLFGRRLPEIMRGLGASVREFKKGMEDPPPPPPPLPPPAATEALPRAPAAQADAAAPAAAPGAPPAGAAKP